MLYLEGEHPGVQTGAKGMDKAADGETIETLDDEISLPLREFDLLNKELDALEGLIADERDDQIEGYVSLEESTRLKQEIADLTTALVQSDWSPTTHANMRISAAFRLFARDLPVRSSLSAHNETREEQIRFLKVHYGFFTDLNKIQS